MTPTFPSTTQRAWSQAIAQPAQEFPQTPLEVLSGEIPPQLRGTLYRNGPARLERGGERVGHWFDGDGAVLAVNFGETGATATYRYVQTEGYQKEAEENQFLFPNYGMTAAGPVWNNWTRPVKNTANTSVLALSDRLLALWEGGNPHALDLETQATFGTDQLAYLDPEDSHTAHPKVDQETGEFFSYGVSVGVNATLTVYKGDLTGKIFQSNEIQLSGLPLIHDFVFAGQYLVFFVSPVRVNLLKAGTGLMSYSEAMEWKPELGTEVIIIERDTLEVVSRETTDPWYQWHFTNGYTEEDGTIVVEMVAYKDFQTNQRLKEVATGQIKTPASGKLWEVRVNPQTAAVIERKQLLDRDCEFPGLQDKQVGKPWRYTYLSTHRDGVDTTAEIYGAIARYDRHTQTLEIADCGENRYPTEPILAGTLADPQWVLTVVYDGNLNQSQVWIYEGDHLSDEPVCRLALPSVIPPSFHGTWVNSGSG
jgi:all-trans-8'-apo-beta-carotenal 15,15'-oxygenase